MLTAKKNTNSDIVIENMETNITDVADGTVMVQAELFAPQKKSGGGIRGTIMTGGGKEPLNNVLLIEGEKYEFKASAVFDRDNQTGASKFVDEVKKHPQQLVAPAYGMTEINEDGVKINYPNSDDDEKDLVNKQNKIENLEAKIKVLQKELRNNKVESSNDDFLVVVQIDENFRQRFAESKKYMTLQIPPEKEGDEPTLFNIEKPKTIPSNEYLLIKPPNKADKAREALRKVYDDQIEDLSEKLAIAEKAAQRGINLCKLVKGQAGMKDIFGKLPVVGSMLFPEGTPEEREKRKEEKLAKKRQKIREDLAFNEEIKKTKRQSEDEQLKYKLKQKQNQLDYDILARQENDAKLDAKQQRSKIAREENDAKLESKSERNIRLREQKQSELQDKNEAFSQKRQDITDDKEVQNQAKTRKRMDSLDQRTATLKRRTENKEEKEKKAAARKAEKEKKAAARKEEQEKKAAARKKEQEKKEAARKEEQAAKRQ